MSNTTIPAGYEGDVHACVKKRTGRTWYALGSSCCHITNTVGVEIFNDTVAEMNAQFSSYEFAVMPYESRKGHPFKFVIESDQEDPAFEIEHDGWV